MALTSNDFTAPMTKNVKLKSSVYEKIILIGADETPLLNKIGSSNVKNPLLHSWLIDTLEKPKKNAHLEVSDISENTTNTTQKTSNATQIFKTEVMVSDTLLKAQQYGGNEMAYQMEKKVKEHKLDIEYSLFGLGRDTDAKVSVFKDYVEPNATQAGEMAGLFHYIAKGEKTFKDGKCGNILAFDTDKNWGAKRTKIEMKHLNAILKNVWDKGIEAKDVFIGANLLEAIAEMITRQFKNETKIVNHVISLTTGYGTINFHKHRFLDEQYGLGDVIIAGDFSFIKHGLYIPTNIKQVTTSKTAQAKRIFTQSTLEVRNADAFCIGVGLGV